MASAKLANRTVNQSQAATSPAKTLLGAVAVDRSRTKRNVVKTLPTSTTNITGFRAIFRGSSFTIESRLARRTIAPENSELERLGRLAGGATSGAASTRVTIR